MAKIPVIALPPIFAFLVAFMSFLYRPIALRYQVLGIGRGFKPIKNIHGADLNVIPDTLYCEDLHYHEPSNLLFAASEENDQTRWNWFPPSVVIPSRRKADPNIGAEWTILKTQKSWDVVQSL